MKNRFLTFGIVIGALSLVVLLAACAASVQPAPSQETAALSAQASSPQSSASELPVVAAMHHPGMDASALMTHTMPMAGGMDHSTHMTQMTEDMEAMMQRMVKMHGSMVMTHTMPITGTMPMAGATGSMVMTHEQHMGRMMIMMGRMMQMMGEMQMQGGMSGMGSGGMDHGSMGNGMCDMMGGEGCNMMDGMGGMGAGVTMTATQALTATAPAGETVAAPLSAPDTRTSEAGSLTVSVTPLNLADPQSVTLDFALVGDGPGIDPGVDLAPLASLRFGSQQVLATAWQPESGVLSFPASDLTGVRTVILMIRNLAGAPLRTFTWTLSQ